MYHRTRKLPQRLATDKTDQLRETRWKHAGDDTSQKEYAAHRAALDRWVNEGGAVGNVVQGATWQGENRCACCHLT